MSAPTKLWTTIFGVWLLFLSGLFNSFTGSPGFFQHFRLRGLLRERQETLAALNGRLHDLQVGAARLESSPAVQEREIRRVLGYAAPGELFFDFR